MSFFSSFGSAFDSVKSVFVGDFSNIQQALSSIIAREQNAAAALDYSIKWAVKQGPVLQAGLNEATPMLTALATAVSVLSPNAANAKTATSAINGVNAALSEAQVAVKALNNANAALQANAASGAGVADTAAVISAVKTVMNANAKVAAVSDAALNAAQIIHAIGA